MFNADNSTPTLRPALHRPEVSHHTETANTNAEHMLFDAIASSDTAAIQTILQHPGLDLSQVNQNGQTLLHVAAHHGNAEALRDLIQYFKDGKAVLGCDSDDWRTRIGVEKLKQQAGEAINDFKLLDAQDTSGRSPLMLAAQNGNIAAIQVLIDAGADIDDVALPIEPAIFAVAKKDLSHLKHLNATLSLFPEIKPSRHGYTALILAVENGHTMAVEKLVNNGATLRAIGKQGETPLMIAVKSGQIRSAKTLISAGANVNDQATSMKETALSHAVRYDKVDMIHLLLDAKANIAHKNRNGYPMLTIAAELGHIAAIKAICAHDADIEITAKQRLRPLTVAAIHGQVPAIETLLDLGANIDAIDANEKTALIHAAENNRSVAVKILIERGALANSTIEQRNTLLMLAAAHDSVELIAALLQPHVDLNIRNEFGRTPLMIAAKAGHVRVVEALLKAGADSEIRDHDKYTAMMTAAENNQAAVIHVLHAHHAKLEVRSIHGDLSGDMALFEEGITTLALGKTALLIAAASGHDAAVAALIQIGADINARDNFGATSLTLATEKRHINTISTLLKHGANLELRNEQRLTPFMIAANRHDIPIMKALHAAGANINATDANGHSALTSAIQEGDMEKFHTLMQLSPDLNLVNPAGRSPLRIAIERGRFDMARHLINAGADVNIGDQHNITPIMAASRLNQVNVMRWLAHAGADARAQSTRGHDAMNFAILADARDAQQLLLTELNWRAGPARSDSENGRSSGV